MKDPFNPSVSIGNIRLLGSADNRSELINGDWLPMKSVEGYTIRAQRRQVIGRNQDAIDDYEQATEIAPNNGDLYFYKGQTYAAMEKKRRRSLPLRQPQSSSKELVSTGRTLPIDG